MTVSTKKSAFKKLIYAFVMIVALAIGFWSVGYFDARKLVDVVVYEKIDASFYIIAFHNINHAKNHAQLSKSLSQTLADFKRLQQSLDKLWLNTPSAKDVRDEYTKGINALEKNLADTQKDNQKT